VGHLLGRAHELVRSFIIGFILFIAGLVIITFIHPPLTFQLIESLIVVLNDIRLWLTGV
jgi:hypothetical protein